MWQSKVKFGLFCFKNNVIYFGSNKIKQFDYLFFCNVHVLIQMFYSYSSLNFKIAKFYVASFLGAIIYRLEVCIIYIITKEDPLKF